MRRTSAETEESLIMKAEKENRERKIRYEERQAESGDQAERNSDETIDDDVSTEAEDVSHDDSNDEASLDAVENPTNGSIEEEEQ